MESLKNVCPAVTSGRERITLTHRGGEVWTTGKVRLALPVMLALRPWFSASQASLPLLQLFPPADALAKLLQWMMCSGCC